MITFTAHVEGSYRIPLIMHAVDFYTSTCRSVMQADPDNPSTLVELRRHLPCLRQSLSCYVCFKLLKDPMGPNHSVCRHYVCLNCLGGKMKLKPACSWCKDHCQFVPNPLLKILVTCFKKLCLYIFCSPLGKTIKNSSVNGETNHLFKIVQEGMEFHDDYVPHTSHSQTVFPVDRSPPEVDPVSEVPSTTHLETNKVEDSFVSSENTEVSNVKTAEWTKGFISPSVELDDIRFIHSKKKTAKHADHNYENKLHTKINNKTTKKPVIFLKRAAINRRKSKSKVHLKSALHSLKTDKKKRVSVKKINTRHSKQDAPSDLERIDSSEPSLKKVKVELQPPELKPLSSCNCGKSGNFNQLTCIGQRCPCYSMKLPCVGCKCRGCRNPKKVPDYKGINTIGSSAVLRSGTRNATEALCVNV